MRVRKKPWAAQELAENPRILKAMPQAGEIPGFFTDKQALHVELGCGKGRFISQTAERAPNINHLAIEREPIVLAMAARKAAHLDNVAFLEMDGQHLPEIFVPGQVDRLYINFCDPWPRKKKWAKRRLTHVNFLAMYEFLRIPEIFFKTDNRILFEFSINQFSERGWKMRAVSLDLHNSGIEDNIMTEYEEKFSPHGPIYRLEAYFEYGSGSSCH